MTARVKTVLKEDGLGRVELLEGPTGRRIRRVACGGRVPGSGLLARALLRRERAALSALEGLAGVPALESDEAWASAPSQGGRAPDPRDVLVRTFCDGRALHEAEALPVDFFDRLIELVGRMHARGVCHNDLHKEQNVVVGEDGWPAVVDFQLASVHRGSGRRSKVRREDDLRHVEKHLRRYTRDGRGASAEPGLEPPRPEPGAARRPRSRSAATWRRFVKPVYNAVTRRLDWKDGEPRRASSGPWPVWTAPLAGPGAREPQAPR